METDVIDGLVVKQPIPLEPVESSDEDEGDIQAPDLDETMGQDDYSVSTSQPAVSGQDEQEEVADREEDNLQDDDGQATEPEKPATFESDSRAQPSTMPDLAEVIE